MEEYDRQEEPILDTLSTSSTAAGGLTRYVIFSAVSRNGMARADLRDSIRASKSLLLVPKLTVRACMVVGQAYGPDGD